MSQNGKPTPGSRPAGGRARREPPSTKALARPSAAARKTPAQSFMSRDPPGPSVAAANPCLPRATIACARVAGTGKVCVESKGSIGVPPVRMAISHPANAPMLPKRYQYRKRNMAASGLTEAATNARPRVEWEWSFGGRQPVAAGARRCRPPRRSVGRKRRVRPMACTRHVRAGDCGMKKREAPYPGDRWASQSPLVFFQSPQVTALSCKDNTSAGASRLPESCSFAMAPVRTCEVGREMDVNGGGSIG